mmetsp:Transcript_6038/g.26681  ORF Transcript_6038/g.26681 Transcript_6038/m.26681 type:complete len:226 (-) Transcript_6038:2606-3283(-)
MTLAADIADDVVDAGGVLGGRPTHGDGGVGKPGGVGCSRRGKETKPLGASGVTAVTAVTAGASASARLHPRYPPTSRGRYGSSDEATVPPLEQSGWFEQIRESAPATASLSNGSNLATLSLAPSTLCLHRRANLPARTNAAAASSAATRALRSARLSRLSSPAASHARAPSLIETSRCIANAASSRARFRPLRSSHARQARQTRLDVRARRHVTALAYPATRLLR